MDEWPPDDPILADIREALRDIVGQWGADADPDSGDRGATPGMDSVALDVRKYGTAMPVSDGLLMDEGLIPDTRPPLPPESRRVRFRRWRREVVYRWRVRAGSWVAGVDLDEENDW